MTPKITALEIQKHEFALKRRGYEPEAVRSFLMSIAEDFQEIMRQNGELETRLRHLEEENADHRDREKILKETLLSAGRRTTSSARRRSPDSS